MEPFELLMSISDNCIPLIVGNVMPGGELKYCAVVKLSGPKHAVADHFAARRGMGGNVVQYVLID